MQHKISYLISVLRQQRVNTQGGLCNHEAVSRHKLLPPPSALNGALSPKGMMEILILDSHP